MNANETAQKAVARAIELAESGMAADDAAVDVTNQLPRAALVILARAAVIDRVRSAQRQEVLRVERRATAKQPRPGSKAYVSWVENTDEGASFHAQREEQRRAHDAGLVALLTDYQDRLKLVWTDELLATEFALADGSKVTWGSATVAEHAQRRDMFLNNASANIEGAARHSAAIQELEASGADCLAHLAVAA